MSQEVSNILEVEQDEIIDEDDPWIEEACVALADLDKLKTMSAAQLLELSKSVRLDIKSGTSKYETMFYLKKRAIEINADARISGIVDITKSGFGFLRFKYTNYSSGSNDIYISSQQIARYGIRSGDEIYCKPRLPVSKNEKYFAIHKIYKINGQDSNRYCRGIAFQDLTPIFPQQRIVLEMPPHRTTLDTLGNEDLTNRIIELFAPLGKGQRALIVAQPKAGKTGIMHNIAHAIEENHPECHLIILLIDERPEEVTDFRRSVKSAEVLSSTFDEHATRHVQVAEMVIDRAKRLVEQGRDVVILLDSITRLARAYNSVAPSSGKILTGGVDANALQYPKRFFGAARNIEGGGSLTIIGTALVDTGSKMDEFVYEEFKGTGNCELMLDRKLADKKIFPAIDIVRSGTRKEEILMSSEELSRCRILRKILASMKEIDGIEFLKNKMQGTQSNKEFFQVMMQQN